MTYSERHKEEPRISQLAEICHFLIPTKKHQLAKKNQHFHKHFDQKCGFIVVFIYFTEILIFSYENSF